MDPRRWQSIKELFHAALDQEPSDRVALLDAACGADHELRAEVESLLNSDANPDELLDRPPVISREPADLDETAARMVGRVVGRYEIRSVLASGGMGVVFEAVQESPRRVVALKLMRQGLASRWAQRRFQDESQVMGRLLHPGICQIFEAGIHVGDEGPVPYFAMELVPDARTLTEFAAAGQLGIRQRLEMFMQVCEAVNHGHLRGVIHRDLKPANILVNSGGQAKVIDFGVARLTDTDMAVATMRTSVGQLVGTLQYMAPEQCEADPTDLDVRSDVYSLGVVLYELLVGRPPYEVSRTSVVSAIRTVREAQPAPPSTLDPRLRGDLEVIVFRALEKDRAHRYQSAAELAADIRRYLADEPILARRPSAIHQLRLLARRHRAVFRAAVLSLLTLLIATAVSMRAAATARREQRRAEIQTYCQRLSAASAAIERHDVADAVERLDEAAEGARLADIAGAPGWEMGHLRTRLNRSLFAADTGGPDAIDVDVSPNGELVAVALRRNGWQIWSFARHEDRPELEQVVHVSCGNVQSVCFLGEGDRLAISVMDDPSNEPRFDVWNVTQPDRPVRFEPRSAAVLRGGSLAAGRAGASGFLASCMLNDIALWCDGFEAPQFLRGHERVVTGVTFDGQGKLVASVSLDCTVRLWNLEDMKPAAILRGHKDHTEGTQFDSTGRLLTTVSLDGTVRIWNVERSTEEYRRDGEFSSGAQIDTIHGGGPGFTSAALQPRGTLLACGATDSTVRLWELDFARLGRVWQPPALSEAWPVTQHREIAILQGHHGPVRDVEFHPSGKWLVSAGEDGHLLVWAAGPAPANIDFEGHSSSVVSVCFHPSGRWFASGSGDGTVRIWDVEAGDGLISLYSHGDAVDAVLFSPAGDLLASVSRNELIQVHKVISDDRSLTIERNDTIAEPFNDEHWFESIAFSPDGRRLAGCRSDGLIKVWELAPDGTPGKVLQCSNSAAVHAVAFADESGHRLIAGGGSDASTSSLVLWDVDRGQVLAAYPSKGGSVLALALSRDRGYVATGAADGTLSVWTLNDERRLELLWSRHEHSGALTALAFHPRAPRLFTGSSDGSVRIWDLSLQQSLAVFRGHIGAVQDLELNRVGNRLLTSSSGHQGLDNLVKLWEVDASPERRADLIQLRARHSMVHSAAENLVLELFNECVTVKEVLERLAAMNLDEEVKDGAECLAKFLGDDPMLLMWKCWFCVSQQGRADDDYRAALRRVELAGSIVPQERFSQPDLLRLAHGTALYRNRRYEEALVLLKDVEKLCPLTLHDSGYAPAVVAVQVMVLEKLDRHVEAREHVVAIKTAVAAGGYPRGVDLLLMEAVSTIAD